MTVANGCNYLFCSGDLRHQRKLPRGSRDTVPSDESCFWARGSHIWGRSSVAPKIHTSPCLTESPTLPRWKPFGWMILSGQCVRDVDATTISEHAVPHGIATARLRVFLGLEIHMWRTVLMHSSGRCEWRITMTPHQSRKRSVPAACMLQRITATQHRATVKSFFSIVVFLPSARQEQDFLRLHALQRMMILF